MADLLRLFRRWFGFHCVCVPTCSELKLPCDMKSAVRQWPQSCDHIVRQNTIRFTDRNRQRLINKLECPLRRMNCVLIARWRWQRLPSFFRCGWQLLVFGDLAEKLLEARAKPLLAQSRNQMFHEQTITYGTERQPCKVYSTRALRFFPSSTMGYGPLLLFVACLCGIWVFCCFPFLQTG